MGSHFTCILLLIFCNVKRRSNIKDLRYAKMITGFRRPAVILRCVVLYIALKYLKVIYDPVA